MAIYTSTITLDSVYNMNTVRLSLADDGSAVRVRMQKRTRVRGNRKRMTRTKIHSFRGGSNRAFKVAATKIVEHLEMLPSERGKVVRLLKKFAYKFVA